MFWHASFLCCPHVQAQATAAYESRFAHFCEGLLAQRTQDCDQDHRLLLLTTQINPGRILGANECTASNAPSRNRPALKAPSAVLQHRTLWNRSAFCPLKTELGITQQYRSRVSFR